MDWLQKNYERVALIAGVLILLVSALAIFRSATSFSDQFAEFNSHPPQRPPSPPGKASEVEKADQSLNHPPQWTFSGRSGLFVPEKHFIAANGEPATLQTTEVHPPVPNEWFEQFNLSIADADALEQDPDGDGFTNLEEWQGHTNPTDRNSHPEYYTKLKLISTSEEPFRLIFSSWMGDTYQINTIDFNQPTQFLKVGDTIKGTRFKIAKFVKKYEPNKYGTNVDVSELTLEQEETKQQLTLVKEKVAMSPESVATFVYTWGGRREFQVRKDQEFSLKPQEQTKYKLIDIVLA